MSAGRLVGGAMAIALADHRDRFNAEVAQARRTYVDFDIAALEHQLRGSLATTVEACERVVPGSGPRALAALFGPVVELVGQRRLGGGTHDRLLASLPSLARLLVHDPRLVFGSLANAIAHLHRSGVPSDEWLDRVRAAGAGGDPATALRAGQVAAWALGLSHFREGALGVAATLSDDVLGAALGAAGALPASETVKLLREDRWWRPGRSIPAGPALAHRVGGFRGFGGPFLAPPRVRTVDEDIVVSSGQETWTLHADAWGATLVRRESDGAQLGSPASPAGTTAVGPDMTALTLPTSYRVLVVEPGR